MSSGNTYIDLLVGTLTFIGGIVFVLCKYGLISFGREKALAKDSGGNGIKICSAHTDMLAKLNGVYDQQLRNNAHHHQHKLELKRGREQFEKITDTLLCISKNLAVLKDRSDRVEREKNGV